MTDRLAARLPQHSAGAWGARQLLLVCSAGWRASRGVVGRFARPDPAVGWQRAGPWQAVALGCAGLGWGLGLHPGPGRSGPRKREGDGRSPAGVFALGPAFGSSPASAVSGLALPYLLLTPGLAWVDDPASRHYNRLVNTSRVRQDWRSAEPMCRPDGLYRLGLVVGHNPRPSQPKAGSAIFLHVWRGPRYPTSGCTAMPERSLRTLLEWLEAGAHPVMAQLPQAEWIDRWQAWDLPAPPDGAA